MQKQRSYSKPQHVPLKNPACCPKLKPVQNPVPYGQKPRCYLKPQHPLCKMPACCAKPKPVKTQTRGEPKPVGNSNLCKTQMPTMPTVPNPGCDCRYSSGEQISTLTKAATAVQGSPGCSRCRFHPKTPPNLSAQVSGSHLAGRPSAGGGSGTGSAGSAGWRPSAAGLPAAPTPGCHSAPSRPAWPRSGAWGRPWSAWPGTAWPGEDTAGGGKKNRDVSWSCRSGSNTRRNAHPALCR